jgi:hypothetical protein
LIGIDKLLFLIFILLRTQPVIVFASTPPKREEKSRSILPDSAILRRSARAANPVRP